MRLTHRVPPDWTPPPDEIDEKYQRELDLALLHAARRAHREVVSEQKRLERELRKTRDAEAKALGELLEQTRVLVEQRWLELCALEKQMQEGAVRTHRVRATTPNQSKV